MKYFLILFCLVSFAEKKVTPQTSRSNMPNTLEVKGQSRKPNMNVFNQEKSDEIRFATPRKNYRKEILETVY
jgi:hypothetical protein